MSVPIPTRKQLKKRKPKRKNKEVTFTLGEEGEENPNRIVLLQPIESKGVCEGSQHGGIYFNDELKIEGGALGKRQAFFDGEDHYAIHWWKHPFADKKGRKWILFINGLEYESKLPAAEFWKPLYWKTAICGLVLVVLGTFGLFSFIETGNVWASFLVRVFFVFGPFGLYYLFDGMRGLIRYGACCCKPESPFAVTDPNIQPDSHEDDDFVDDVMIDLGTEPLLQD